MATTMTNLMDDLYHRIEHGAPAHREWLRGQLAAFAAEHESQWSPRYDAEQRPVKTLHMSITDAGTLELGGVIPLGTRRCGDESGFGPPAPCARPFGHMVHRAADGRQWRCEEFDQVRDVDDLVRKFAWAYEGAPRRLPADLADARREVLQEELEEYLTAAAHAHDAVQQRRDPGAHLAACLDALVDLVVASMITAAQHGFDFRQAWRRVHEANMAKELATPDRPSTRGRTSLDLVKPDGWRPPQHLDLVTPNAHWCPTCEYVRAGVLAPGEGVHECVRDDAPPGQPHERDCPDPTGFHITCPEVEP